MTLPTPSMQSTLPMPTPHQHMQHGHGERSCQADIDNIKDILDRPQRLARKRRNRLDDSIARVRDQVGAQGQGGTHARQHNGQQQKQQPCRHGACGQIPPLCTSPMTRVKTMLSGICIRSITIRLAVRSFSSAISPSTKTVNMTSVVSANCLSRIRARTKAMDVSGDVPSPVCAVSARPTARITMPTE